MIQTSEPGGTAPTHSTHSTHSTHLTPPAPSSSAPPEPWAERLAAGDASAANDLVERYFEPTLRFVRTSIHDRHLAEDITQDVFLSLIDSLSRFDPQRSIEPWIYTIASNKLRDHFRSRRFQEARRAASVEEGGADHVPSPLEEPPVALQGRERAKRLREAIDGLSEKLRATVLLRVDQGLPFATIADLLGSGEAAVRKRFSRAVVGLQQALVLEPPSPCPDGVPCA